MLAVELLDRLANGRALVGLECFAASRQSPGVPLELLHPLGQLLLLSREPSQPVSGRAVRHPVLGKSSRLGRDLPLRISELARLELQIAHRPPALIRPAVPDFLFELAQPLEGLLAPPGGLRGILPPQVARCGGHLLADAAHALSQSATGLASLSSGLLSARLLLPGLLLSGLLLLGKLARQVLSLPAQLGLFSRQGLEPAFEFFGAQLRLPLRQVGQFLGELFLPPGQIADLVERVRLGRLVAALGAGRRLVVILLLPAKLPVEQRRQIALPTASARPLPLGVLLPRHLAPADLGIQPEELVERLHFMRQRAACLQRVERSLGSFHRLAGSQERFSRHARHLRWVIDFTRSRPPPSAARTATPVAAGTQVDLTRDLRDAVPQFALASTARRSSFQVATMMSFCAAVRLARFRPPIPAPIPACDCAATNSSS